MEGLNDCLPYVKKLSILTQLFCKHQNAYTAATKKLLNDFFGDPSLSMKTDWLALSIRNSGIKINPFNLKLADSVVAKIFPPVGAALNIFNWFSSLKYSPRSVSPNQLCGSTFR